MRKVFLYLSFLTVAITLFSCTSVDDERIPFAPVYVSFSTVGDWQIYGVSGALEYNRFIKSEKIPAGYPYAELSQTGFGGVLLVASFEGNPQAFDLSCPVECKQNVRIFVNEENLVGECPQCHSTYDIFRFGGPLSGLAAEKGYALRRYAVSSPATMYKLISN